MQHLGYHRTCGGEVVLRVYRGTRQGFDRFAEPDYATAECLECGEDDLSDEEIADSYEAAMGENDEEEEDDECSTL